MQHARDFERLAGDTIEDHMRMREDRTEARDEFVSRSSHKWMLLEPIRGPLNIEQNIIRDLC
jgi:hypothetical protein